MSLLAGDRELLRRYRSGEQEALARVYREYAPAVAAFLARGFTFSSKGRTLQFYGYQQPFDLENSVQETFVRAFSQRARLAYDGLSPFKSYVMAIARNVVLNELRQREVAMSQLVGDADEQAVDRLATEPPPSSAAPHPDAEVELLRRELLGLYRSFTEELSPEHRAFFQARFEARRTQVEAGKQCGLSHMQARTLEKRLRQRFLAYMQARGYLHGSTAKAHAALCLVLGV